ncbi:MAG: acyl-CoA dehydrogenase family protein [Dehalococcoidales bacterium]|jgi:alkylation response protein AidB-like acyl-CoA dehydrogenase|nr:acyl-CoA dehydrogenase family protein [Dehalococcoidales bacterium]
MDFDLTEEQRTLQTMVKEFTKREIEPIADQLDREGRLPDDLIGKFAQIGLLGMTVLRKYGGSEAGDLNCLLAIEQLAYSGTGAWWLVGFNNSIPECISGFGSETIREQVLQSFCDGTAYASVQFTEEATGSEPAMLTTTCVPDGDSYLINGMKRFSTFGARDGYAVTYTKDEEGKCTAFVIEKRGKGYSAPKIWELMGGGGIEAADVYFEDFRVPKQNILGKKGGGMEVLLPWIATEKLQQCAAATGMAQAALDEAIKYLKTRTSKGRPISEMQGVRWMLAEMEAKIEACRWLTYKTGFTKEQGHGNWQTEAAATKVFVMPAAAEVVEMSRRLHGAYGYTREFKIEKLYRAIAGCSVIAVSLEVNKSIVGASLAR